MTGALEKSTEAAWGNGRSNLVGEMAFVRRMVDDHCDRFLEDSAVNYSKGKEEED